MTKEKIRIEVGDKVLVGVGDLEELVRVASKYGFVSETKLTCPVCGKFKIIKGGKITSTFKHKCKVTP